MDTGWDRPDDRDTRRIEAAMQDAGIERLDFLIASHFHRDHVGGLRALSERVEIGQFIDHGDSVEQGGERGRMTFETYLNVVDGRRHSVVPGDRLRVTGVDFSLSQHTGPSGSGPRRWVRMCSATERPREGRQGREQP